MKPSPFLVTTRRDVPQFRRFRGLAAGPINPLQLRPLGIPFVPSTTVPVQTTGTLGSILTSWPGLVAVLGLGYILGRRRR